MKPTSDEMPEHYHYPAHAATVVSSSKVKVALIEDW